MKIDNNKQMASLYSLYSARMSEQLGKEKRHAYDDMQIKAALDTLLAAPFRRCPRFMVDGWHSNTEECPHECGHCQGTGWIANEPAQYNPLLKPLSGFHAGGFVHGGNPEGLPVGSDPCLFLDTDPRKLFKERQEDYLKRLAVTVDCPIEKGINYVDDEKQQAKSISLVRRLLGKRRKGQ